MTTKTKASASTVRHVDGQAIVTLSRPAVVNGQKVDTVTMREPTVRDQRAAQAYDNPVDVEIHAIANLCMMSPDDVEALPMRDFKRLQLAYMGFID